MVIFIFTTSPLFWGKHLFYYLILLSVEPIGGQCLSFEPTKLKNICCPVASSTRFAKCSFSIIALCFRFLWGKRICFSSEKSSRTTLPIVGDGRACLGKEMSCGFRAYGCILKFSPCHRAHPASGRIDNGSRAIFRVGGRLCGSCRWKWSTKASFPFTVQPQSCGRCYNGWPPESSIWIVAWICLDLMKREMFSDHPSSVRCSAPFVFALSLLLG